VHRVPCGERSNRVVSGAPWLKAKRSEAWAELQFQLGVGRKREKNLEWSDTVSHNNFTVLKSHIF
jgi:hypothetical protein